jgi:hypothetical protein
MSNDKIETDDVLDFINSLPDSGKPDLKQDSRLNGEKLEGNDEELLDFLDELAQHETLSVNNQTKQKFEPKKKNKPEIQEKLPDLLGANDKDTNDNDENHDINADHGVNAGDGDIANGDDIKNVTHELDIDPIGSISNWWNKEGSTKVNSFWGSLTNNAQQISEQTYQLASTTTNEINKQRQKYLNSEDEALTSKLNSLLINVSHQITSGLMSKDDELLNILLIYDVNLNYLDRLVNENFNRVMNQVEGGIKVSVTNFNHTHSEPTGKYIDLNMFYGKLIDGEKLGFANLESSIKDFNKITQESKQKTQHLESVEDINQSNIFISIQPITTRIEGKETEIELGPIIIDSANQNSFSFTIILKDITNDIIIVSKTQPFPLIWAKWLNGELLESFKGDDGEDIEGVDPTEWVKDWIKEGISLSFGVVAQQYVIKRMGF